MMAAIYHAVCDGREVSRGVRQMDSEITRVTSARYHAVCDGREISRGVRWTDSEITRV